MFKRTISIVVALLLIITLTPVEALQQLNVKGADIEIALREGTYSVIVVSPEMIPIPRAKVRLMGIDQETDASGVAVFNCKEESLTETIFVQANEYRPRDQICNVRPKDYCYIVMEHKEEPNRPYISMYPQ